ncbi:MAG: hypothetical protein IJT02_08175 [Synergistaceae bacterium]|nr:hypothetical protein [Synergistaceae bacterium]
MTRRMRKSFWEVLNKVTELVELVITCHPQGFRVLLGEVPVPTSLEVHEMMNAGRSRLAEDFRATMPNLETEAERIVYDCEHFDELVELAGGWQHIYIVSREFRDSDVRMWSVVMDHMKFVTNASTRNTSRLKRVASKYGMSPNTVMKYRRDFPLKLAEMIVMPTGDNFHLIPC